MCDCINVEIGSYANQVVLNSPENIKAFRLKSGFLDEESASTVCVDSCIEDEIKMLWEKGITTTGCCCGHNIHDGYIGVIVSDIDKMIEMGYEVQFNSSRPGDRDSFYPKSVTRFSENFLIKE